MNYNYVEEKVDTFMIDKLESKYPGVKGKISKASKHSKRMAIASILGNREIFELIKKTIDLQKSDKYLTNLDELVVLFRKYVEVADVEKKTLGEVMTPITLVEQMLNTLPSEVWSNPNLKWLDPCAGVGTFPSIVVQRLMKGLENVIPNPEKRYGHIIENMIYVCELQDKNLFVFNCVFDLGDNNATNSYCGSFLDENFDKHMSDVWGVEKFDIVMGNPPYQTSNEGETKTQPIWQLFVEKSLNILIEDGYLNMVHPGGWRNIDGKFKSVQKMMTERQIQYLKIHTFKDGLKTFGAKINYDYYCLKNRKTNNFKTKIVCENGDVVKYDLSKVEFIPGENIEEIYSLIAKDGEDKVQLSHSFSFYETRKEWMSKVKTPTNKYPCVYMVSYLNEPTFYYSSHKKEFFNTPKVVWGNGSTGVIIDKDGEYGLTQFAYGIVDDVKNLDSIKKAITSEKFISKIMLFKDGLGDKYNRKIIASFRKDFWKEFVDYGEDYLKSKVENKNILNIYEKLEEKILTLNGVDSDIKQTYKNFKKGNVVLGYVYFLKEHIHFNIRRGHIKRDGPKSKGFFTLNDQRNICTDVQYFVTEHDADFIHHRIVIDETTDIDYVYSLILQKYNTI